MHWVATSNREMIIHGRKDWGFLLIVAGWHFKKEFYKNLFQISEHYPNLKILISSHKNEDQISRDVISTIERIKNCEIKFFKNDGFDWGMYSKAIKYLRDEDELFLFRYACFMHDDVKILNNNFLYIFEEYIEKNNFMVLGNCTNLQKSYPRKFKESHPHIIEWGRLSYWGLSIKSSSWNSVRGSCFFARSEVFEKIKEIPYKTGGHVEFGNWSLILFSGLIADNFGASSIGYYSPKYLESDLVLEHERGYIAEKNEGQKISSVERAFKNLGRIFFLCTNNPLIAVFKLYSYMNSKLYKMSESGLRLNLGRNLVYKEGYLNIDVSDNIEADLVIDVKDIVFEEHSVNKIILNDILSNCSGPEVVQILKKVFSWLKKHGVLIIEDKKRDNGKVLRESLKKFGCSKVLREFPIQNRDDLKNRFRLVAVK